MGAPKADPDGAAGHDPELGQVAVAALLLGLRSRLDAAGVTPNPADVDTTTMLDRVGGDDAWTGTVGYDRPLLVARRVVRRVVRRVLDPQAPTDVYCPWAPP